MGAKTGAHPRSRGENTSSHPRPVTRTGSSPLTRGKRYWLSLFLFLSGLIPAHAGKTRPRLGARWRARAHPRSRGENSMSCLSSAKFAGSSPLTRGKRARVLARAAMGGLIPAHAGKTGASLMVRTPLWAHPRSRGENPIRYVRQTRNQGSSPLTRGKPRVRRSRRRANGLIPAHAGKTTPACESASE